MAKERTYTVAWYIDVDSTSPEAAAEQANELLNDPEHIPWTFVVAPKQAPRKMRGEAVVDMEDLAPLPAETALLIAGGSMVVPE